MVKILGYYENLQYVSALNIVDEYTVKFTLSQEVEFFEYNLTFPIISKAYFENEDFWNTVKNNYIIGTGMFKVVEKTDNSIKLVKNEEYWNKEEKNSLITDINIALYNTIGDEYTAFKSGYIDIMDITVNNIEEYVGSLGYSRAYYEDRNVDFLCFNTQDEMVSDPNVRKAIALLLDKNNIVANLGNGYTVSNFLLPSNSWIYNENLNVYYNAEQADELLMQSGWNYQNNTWVKDGRILRFTIVTESGNYARTLSARVIAEQLGNHGIQVNVVEYNSNYFYDSLNKRNFQAIIAGVRNGYSPKISVLFSENNIANYNNEIVINNINEVRNLADYNIIKEKYYEIYNEYLNEFPYIFLYRETDMIIYNQTLCGALKPTPYSIFNNIEKWYRQ